MARSLVAILALLAAAPAARADLEQLARCQNRIAREGAKYANKVIKATLDCTTAVANCQIQCEQGVFGPPCDPVPSPGCCDPADRSSNVPFGNCMNAADVFCDKQTVKIDNAEVRKQQNITNGCVLVTQEELCGTQAIGLNFDALNAGCLALDPSYTCSLPNLLQCVAGPLERQLVDQISAILQPRAVDAVTAIGLQGVFTDIPQVKKVLGTVPAGRADVWAIAGQAGDQVVLRVNTRDDGGGTSSLSPALVFLDAGNAPVPDTTVHTVPCNVPSTCGAGCPQAKRTLPFGGTYHVAVSARLTAGCGAGSYKLVVTSPGSAVPVLVLDDIPASSVFPP